MRLLLYLAGFLVVFTKLLDVLSTLKRIRHYSGETNPLAGRLMRKLGIQTTSWFIFGLVTAIMIYSVWATIDTPTAFQIIFFILCLLISVVQSAVAHSNWSGRLNAITQKVILVHHRVNTILNRMSK